MRHRLFPVWLVARRELRDQSRDWRVLFPLIALTITFPFLMNAVARQAVEFINQYGANLVIDRLVPFSILIIGFFPNTVSLVVALESFVGEKERGTIEPLLSSPLEDWQLYLGKLIIGVVTPLVGSYASMALYLLMVSRLQLTMPGTATIWQLVVLTSAHALLMVSGAIVISVQSTSVKAANLLASFVIIPVALLLQGESVLLFWGDADVLWLAVVGVVIVSALLIRLGIAHFQREYLLGREIDTLDLKWMWRTFQRSFASEARSPREWYLRGVMPATRRLALPMLLMTGVTMVGVWLGYHWVIQNVQTVIEQASP
ncbi:MAG TPA: ABC transporter permease subunit, partial [Anaerolineales bacterium]